MSSIRIGRLSQLIRMKVSQVIMRDISDPRLGLVTVTKIKLAKDLRHCTIGYSVLGDDAEKSKCKHALEAARGYIQSEVAGIMKTRVTPVLEFEFDESIEGSVRIAALLRESLGKDYDNGLVEDDIEDGDDADVDHDDSERDGDG